jgi:hypothetical protein
MSTRSCGLILPRESASSASASSKLSKMRMTFSIVLYVTPTAAWVVVSVLKIRQWGRFETAWINSAFGLWDVNECLQIIAARIFVDLRIIFDAK